MDNISIIYFNNLLRLLNDTVKSCKNDAESYKTFTKIKKGILKSEPFNVRMTGSNMRSLTNIFEKDLVLEKIENVNKGIVFEFLKMYDPFENYGVIIKVDGKLINPFHPFTALNEISVIDSYKENDFIFSIYIYKYKDKCTNKNMVERYKNIIKENLENYFKNKENCYSKINYKLASENSYEMEKLIDSLDDKSIADFIKNNYYKRLVTDYMGSDYDNIYFSKHGDINLNNNEEIIIPVSLATLYISYPYYGLLGIIKNDAGNYTNGVCGRNISSNFISGNIGVHLDSFLSLYRYDEHLFNCIGLERYNLIEACNGNYEHIFRLLDEYGIDYSDNTEEDFSVDESVTADFANGDEEYYNMIISDDIVYSTKVCLGSNAKNISEIDCLSNMNIDSMFSNYTLSDYWKEEATASQQISKEVITSFLDITKSKSNEENKK